MSIQRIVLNSVAASAADLSTPGGGQVNVTGDPNGFVRGQVQEMKLQYFNPEALQNSRVLGTPAANTSYEFYIEQEVDGVINKVLIAHTTTTAPSASALATSITANVQGFIDSGQLMMTAATATSGGDGGVDLLALTGYATFRIIQETNVVETSLMASEASSSTGFSGVAATKTLTALVASTTGIAVGQLHKVTWTGNTETINGNLGSVGTILRVSAFVANTSITYIAESVSANFTGDDSVSVVVATKPRVLGSDLIAQGVTDAVAATVYHEVIVIAKNPSGETLTVPGHQVFEKHYYLDSADSDALALMTRFGEVKQYYSAGATTVDPALL